MPARPASDPLRSRGSAPRPSGPPRSREDQARAFADARRHSRFVRIARVFVPLIGISSAAWVAVPAWTSSPAEASKAPIADVFDGGFLKMIAPVLTGSRSDGTSYRVEATSMRQPVGDADRLLLDGIRAKLGVDSTLTSDGGVYDPKADLLEFDGDVVLHRGESVIRSGMARVDTRTSAVVSDSPVDLVAPGYRVNSDAMEVGAAGSSIHFSGRVRSVIDATRSGEKRGAD